MENYMALDVFRNNSNLNDKQTRSISIIDSLKLQLRLGQAISWHISNKFDEKGWRRRLPQRANQSYHISLLFWKCTHISAKAKEGLRYPDIPG